MTRGKYIIIEGGDGTGKTTQADILQEYLESHGNRVLNLKEPGGSPIGEAIRSVLLDGTLARTPMTNILLFTANRHDLWHATISPALEQGITVIATRNYWSTIAYQGYGEGMSVSEITKITQMHTNERYMNPDYGIILTISDAAEAKRRIAARGVLVKPDPFEAQDLAFQQRVSDGYLAIAKNYRLPVIHADQSIDSVAKEIRDIVAL